MKFAISALAFIFLFNLSFSQAGTLDPNFGQDGIVNFTFPGGSFNAYDVKVQSDDKVLVFGKFFDNGLSMNVPAVARLLSDGSSLDFSFGENGITSLPLNAVIVDIRFDFVIDDEDNIYVLTDAGPESNLAKLSSDGQNDASFGNDGYLQIDYPEGNHLPSDIELDEGGNLYISSQIQNNFGLIKVTSSGQYDATFGTNGRVIHSVNGTDWPHGIAVQEDGKVLVAGTTDDGFGSWVAVVRFNSDGSLDADFGDEGEAIQILESNDISYAVAVDSEDRIVVGGRLGGSVFFQSGFVSRFNSDGSVDASFGSDGWVEIETFGASWFWNMIVQPDDKILGVGVFDANDSDPEFLISRINEDGSPDLAFGSEYPGSITVGIDGTAMWALAADFDSNGDAIIGGSEQSSDSFQLVKLRTGLNLSVEEEMVNRDIAVYPNPTLGSISLNLDEFPSGNVDLQVFDLSGKLIKLFNDLNSEDLIDLDMSRLKKGAYKGVVTSEDARFNFSFVKL